MADWLDGDLLKLSVFIKQAPQKDFGKEKANVIGQLKFCNRCRKWHLTVTLHTTAVSVNVVLIVHHVEALLSRWDCLFLRNAATAAFQLSFSTSADVYNLVQRLSVKEPLKVKTNSHLYTQSNKARSRSGYILDQTKCPYTSLWIFSSKTSLYMFVLCSFSLSCILIFPLSSCDSRLPDAS